MAGAERNRGAATLDLHAQLAQDGEHGIDIANLRYIVKRKGFVGQQTSCQ
jgi:hypothetical protein